MILNYFKGIFDRYNQQNTYKQFNSILNDGRAIFSAFGEDVYLSDFVNNCIDRIATEISKIDIISVVQKPGSIRQQNDDITRLFRFKPNPLQTTKDFLACCEWLRRKDCNCFIYPQYDIVTDVMGNQYRKYTAFYPLNPTQIEIGTDGNNVWEIKFYWRDGSFDILPYDDVIHLKWRRGKNTIVGGGSDYGTPDTANLLSSVKVLDQVLQGLPKSIEASLKITGLYTAKTLIDGDKIKAARDKLSLITINLIMPGLLSQQKEELMGKKNFDKNKMIQRSYGIADFRAMVVPVDDDAPELKRLDGHPAVYDSMTDIGGWYFEVIERGAFDQTDFDDVLLCVNHETRKIPLARSRRNNANSTMRIKTDNVGLYFEADIDVENNQEMVKLFIPL